MGKDSMEALEEAMRRFGEGDWSARVAAADAHAEAFNRMAGNVARELAAGQTALLGLQRRLAGANRLAALGALVGRLSHELGTPLHSVAGHVDLLLADPELPAPVRARAEIISGEIDRLGRLIRGHLKRLRSPQPIPRPTDVNALVERILEVLAPLLSARGVEVLRDLGTEVDVPFPCDPEQLEQVLLNLLQNALDALPDGGRIVVGTAVTERGRAISVADDGAGVPADQVGRVFEPFFTTKGAGHGTGLGLSLCREIALNHGGDIVLDSKPGLGTVVTLSIGEVEA
ncbi:MAG: sensor histidine kinase [Planctomycetota bacterium]|jgi:signal transduction histidine kinase